MTEKIVITIDSELEEIVPLFLENRKNDIKVIENSLKEKDFNTIKRLGHSMKGTGGGYGFDRVTEIGAAIEEAAKNQNSSEIQQQIDTLKDYLERIEIIFE
ncbi:hypothetical protein JCM13304A_22490 [Desulfothermus okinawensis JCM 13304]